MEQVEDDRQQFDLESPLKEQNKEESKEKITLNNKKGSDNSQSKSDIKLTAISEHPESESKDEESKDVYDSDDNSSDYHESGVDKFKRVTNNMTRRMTNFKQAANFVSNIGD